jgi:hypothetical protein
LLARWLHGLLYTGDQHSLNVQHFDSEDWARLQAPKAMQYQWHGAYHEANALWQHIFQQSPQSVFFLKMWLHAVMAEGLCGDALQPVVQTFDGYRGLMFKHFPAFTQVVHLYFLKHQAFQSEDDVTQAWKAMPRADRKQPWAQRVYAKTLMRHGAEAQTEKWLAQEIPHSWDHGLFAVYMALPGDPQAQIKVFNRWLKYSPQSCHIYCYQGLAYAYARCGLWEQTRQMLERVGSDHLTGRAWHELWVMSHLMLHQFDSATQCLFAGSALPGLAPHQEA